MDRHAKLRVAGAVAVVTCLAVIVFYTLGWMPSRSPAERGAAASPGPIGNVIDEEFRMAAAHVVMLPFLSPPEPAVL